MSPPTRTRTEAALRGVPGADPPEQMLLPWAGAPDLSGLFQRVFHRLQIKSPVARIYAAFHPFPGLRSTIALRNGQVIARISDVLAEASPLILEALAEILLARIFRRRPSREARECYLAYTFRSGVRSRIDAVRRERGSKRLLPARGLVFDLEKIFRRLNRRFFEDQLPVPRLGWSHQNSRTLLGHFDSGHAAITVSRLLDSPFVPPYVVEYVVYHEMLHMRFPVERRGHRRVMHSREFREAEKKFPQYELACRQLKHLSAH